MIQAVLLDVDGVAVQPWGFQSLLARDYGITPEMTAPFFRGPFGECLRGRADVLEVLPPFLEAWNWRGTVQEFVAAWLASEDAPDMAVLGVVAAVRKLGVPCFAASSQERHRARYLATEMGFAQRFDGLFFSCDLGFVKPEEGFYRAIQGRLGYAEGELLFFDDSVGNVEGARAAGWFAERFTEVEALRQHLAQHLEIQAVADGIHFRPGVDWASED